MRTGLGRQHSVIPRSEDLWFNLSSFTLQRLCSEWRVSYLGRGALLPISISRKRLRTVGRMLLYLDAAHEELMLLSREYFLTFI